MYSILEALCQEHGVTIAKMCKECGIKRATITELAKGRTKELSPKTAAKIADYFGVSLNAVYGKKENTPENGSVAELLTGLRYEARALLEVLPQMTEEQVKQMTDFAMFLRSQNEGR